MKVTKTILAAAIAAGLSTGAFATESVPSFPGSVTATTSGVAYSQSSVANVNGTSAHTASSFGQNVTGISGHTTTSSIPVEGEVVQGTPEWDPLGATKLGDGYRYTLTGTINNVFMDVASVSVGRTITETSGSGTGLAVADAGQAGVGTITGTIDAGAPAVGDLEDEDYIPARPATQVTSFANVGSGSLAITVNGGDAVASKSDASALNYSSIATQTFTGWQSLEHQNNGNGDWQALQGSAENPDNPVAGAVIGAVTGYSTSATYANTSGVTDPIAVYNLDPANIVPGGDAYAEGKAAGTFSGHVQAVYVVYPEVSAPD